MAMTISAPSSRAPSTGTGAVRKPSTSVRPSNWMGTKSPGYEQEPRSGGRSGPRRKHTNVRNATREAASQGEPHARALTDRTLLTDGERMKFILRIPQPVDGVGYFVFQHGCIHSMPVRLRDVRFDRGMPVL